MYKLIGILFITLISHEVSFADNISCAPNQVQVIDADTIKVCDKKIRLNGISAAERGQSSYVYCKELVRAIIKKSTSVNCKLTGEKTYDRFVGICHINIGNSSKNLQEIIVGNHCARDCEQYSNGKYKIYETIESKKLPLPNYCKKKN